MTNEHQSKNETPAILSASIEQPDADDQAWPQPTAEEEAERLWALGLHEKIDKVKARIEERVQTEVSNQSEINYRDAALIDLNAELELLKKELKPIEAQAESASPVMDSVILPLQRGTVQDAAILDAIRATGYDPLKLPKRQQGKRGIKADVRAMLVGEHPVFPKAGGQFDKAWERLRSRSEITELE